MESEFFTMILLMALSLSLTRPMNQNRAAPKAMTRQLWNGMMHANPIPTHDSQKRPFVATLTTSSARPMIAPTMMANWEDNASTPRPPVKTSATDFQTTAQPFLAKAKKESILALLNIKYNKKVRITFRSREWKSFCDYCEILVIISSSVFLK